MPKLIVDLAWVRDGLCNLLPNELAEALTAYADFESARFTVAEVVVFRSQLRADGPVYTRLRTVALSPR